jgi:uncharacterized protein (DUF427 family)
MTVIKAPEASMAKREAFKEFWTEPADKRIRILFNGAAIAETTRALARFETGRAPRHYIPRADIRMEHLRRGDETSFCPYLGQCAYWDVVVGDRVAKNAAWGYPEVYDDMIPEIDGHIVLEEHMMDIVTVDELEAPLRAAAE